MTFAKRALEYSAFLLTKRSDCKGSSSECETPSVLSGGELGVAIAIPIIVVGAVLGGLAIRAYKVNKKEEKEFQNDPDFYKNYEEYINTNEMPVYPPPAYNNHSMINNDSTDNLSTINPHADTKSGLYPPGGYPGSIRNSGYPASSAGSPAASQINLSRGSLNPFDPKDDRYPSRPLSKAGSAVNLNNAVNGATK